MNLGYLLEVGFPIFAFKILTWDPKFDTFGQISQFVIFLIVILIEIVGGPEKCQNQ